MNQDQRDMNTIAPKRHRIAGLLSALALLMVTSQAWSAGVVTTLADSGPGSLRAAVGGGGAVTFSVTGTIILTSGQIAVPDGTAISGPGANQLAISGNNASRVFNIALATSVSVAGVTLTAGNAGSGQGGAILNAGTLTLAGVAVSANTAGDAGGGIYSSGMLNVSNSVFNGNTVSAADCAGGGAIRSEGTSAVLMLTNSTVTQNIAVSCSGGGISFNGASATISGSTISANTAGSSGGNIYKGSAAAVLTLAGSVVSDGVAGGGTPVNVDLHGALGGFVSSGYNLVESRGDSAGYVASDLADGTAPLLGALAANGGTTATLAFALTSPLRDAAGACALATDQRGFARPQGPACDIGAFEYRMNRLGVTVSGFGAVTATTPPAPLAGGIANCSTSCTADYDGEVAPTVTLTAAPASGQLFSGWSGDCSGSNATSTVVMSAARNCYATFIAATVSVTSSVSGGNGTITPAGLQTVNLGNAISFALAPATHYHIVTPVGGSCGGSLSGNTYTTNAVTVDCSVVATFAINTYTVGGSVSGLVGSALGLRLNGANDISINANGPFTFANPVDDLSTYAVTIAQQPTTPTQLCSISNGAGSVAGSDITNVAVVCAPAGPHFAISVTDNHDYARYGMLLDYVVTITNDGSGDASGVSVTNISPAQLDTANTTWVCQSSGGALCGASGTGALNDTGVSIPAGRSLTWIVTAPLLVNAQGDTVDYTVNASGPASASATDSDILVILRTGFDVSGDDGAETAIDHPDIACATSAPNTSGDRLDLATAQTLTLFAAVPTAPVDTVFAAWGDGGADFRIERLNIDTFSRVRLVTVDKDGIERASAWAAAPLDAVLRITTVSAGAETALLLEGTGVSLSMRMPPGVNGTVSVQRPSAVCE